MTTPKPFSWDRAEARSGKFNGKFLIGVHTTGIYCLPSCTARQPKPENVSICRTEEEAKAAGLRGLVLSAFRLEPRWIPYYVCFTVFNYAGMARRLAAG